MALLREFTTLGVGGPANSLVRITNEADLRRALENPPFLLLGGGSNLVVHDSGWPGTVGLMAITGIEHFTDADRVLVRVGAGEDWNEFVRFCAERGWGGVECLAGIPGTVGATPVQNVGAYGQEVADSLQELKAFDRTTGEVLRLSAAECEFAYRKSRFNSGELNRWVILSLTFALKADATPTLTYRDVTTYFGEGATPSLLEVYHAVREIRGRKGMVVSEADPDSRSAGSFFKNPVVAEADAPEGAPRFPAPAGSVKVPAAWLIEKAGIAKGETLSGGIGISTKHPLALVNQGEATAADVATAAKQVQQRVFDAFGIMLHPEPLFVGPWDPAELPGGATTLLP
ncbi:MAG: UDP-N-acetylmuramate dehydrogenase [Armatimonas sp.]